jgi:hypothetical protein
MNQVFAKRLFGLSSFCMVATVAENALLFVLHVLLLILLC